MLENCSFDAAPYDQSKINRSNNIINLNYTSQDFWSLKARLRAFSKERFGDQFNDYIESDLAIMLLENWAFIGDLLSFKNDQLANEVFIDTVTEVDNAFRICKAFGFQPTPPIAARSLWVASINNPLSIDLHMPPGFSVELNAENRATAIELFAADSENNPLFEDDIIIPAGTSSNKNIIGVEGRTTTDGFIGTGLTNQTFQLLRSPVIYDSIRVDVDGVRWDRVDFFTDSKPRREYRVEFNASYQAFIIFGNSTTGLIPSAGSTITATYRVGGGTIGNIVAGAKETQAVIPVAGFDFNVPVTLRNYTKGEFGYNGDNVEDIRRKLPLWINTQNRAVTGNDYKTLADQFITPYNGQVGKATAVLRNYGCAANIIDIYILARDGADGLIEANNLLKNALSEYFETKKMLTDYVCIKNGSVLLVDVAVDITLGKFYRKFEDEIRSRVTSRVNMFFSLNNWDYGDQLKDTNLIKQLSDIKEVTSFDITFTTNDAENSGNMVTTDFYEIIRPDTINISFVYN